jgi:hypothetical protein
MFFLAFALVFTFPIATIRFRKGRLVWLGARAVARVSAAVALGTSLPILLFQPFLGFMTPAFYLSLPSAVHTPAVVVFAVTAAAMSGWFAFLLGGHKSGERSIGAFASSRWNPARWRAAGKAALTVALAAMSGIAWIAVKYPELPGGGPTRIGAFFVALWAGALAVACLILILFEVTHTLSSSRS